MTMRMTLACTAAILMAALPAMPALAQARLIASNPAEGTAVKGPRILTLTFSEAMSPQTTAASVVMTAMPGVENHGEMVIRNFTTAWSADSKTMTLTLRQPLKAGDYDIRWQAAGADGKRMNGTVRFVVQ
jgi:methionine-rich copper-binding protein CopC